MKFYIIDDDTAMVSILEDIVTDNSLGEVVATETDPFCAYEDIVRMRPDIVLVDFMMSGMDGIKLVSKVRERMPEISFVMISKVTDKAIVHRAYDAGVEFFISKPISIIEVERVLNNVAERIKMRSMMSSIRSMFEDPHTSRSAVKAASERKSFRSIDILLSELGILGESGARDIRAICSYAVQNGGTYEKSILDTVASDQNDNVRNVEQRVRRAIRKGLSNAAHAGLEDIGSDKFSLYANYVYDYAALKDEMNYISGKSESGGRISIPRFIEGLLLYENNM